MRSSLISVLRLSLQAYSFKSNWPHTGSYISCLWLASFVCFFRNSLITILPLTWKTFWLVKWLKPGPNPWPRTCPKAWYRSARCLCRRCSSSWSTLTKPSNEDRLHSRRPRSWTRTPCSANPSRRKTASWPRSRARESGGCIRPRKWTGNASWGSWTTR